MSENKSSENIEQQIVQAARDIFIAKGYIETNMGDIATRIGISRPVLNYYFRTKERLFQAIFGSIVESLAPRVTHVVMRKQMPIDERISKLVDIYFEVFKRYPMLPLFMLREMNRNFDFVAKNVRQQKLDTYLFNLKNSLEAEMQQGTIQPMPVRFIFLTFISLITTPFNIKNLCENMLCGENERFDQMLYDWKGHIVNQLSLMLKP